MNKPVKTDLGNQEIFSRNLKRYIGASGKSQKEIALAIGVSPSAVCDWINHRAYPRVDKLQLLAEYFGIKMSYLTEDADAKEVILSRQEKEILDLFHRVPEEKREFVLSLIRMTINNL